MRGFDVTLREFLTEDTTERDGDGEGKRLFNGVPAAVPEKQAAGVPEGPLDLLKLATVKRYHSSGDLRRNSRAPSPATSTAPTQAHTPLLQQSSKGMLVSRASFKNGQSVPMASSSAHRGLPASMYEESLRNNSPSGHQSLQPTHYLTLQVKQVLDLSIREGKSRSSQTLLDPEEIVAYVKLGDHAVTVVGVFPTISSENIHSHVTMDTVLTVEISITHSVASHGGLLNGLKRLTTSKHNSKSEESKRKRRTVKGHVSVTIEGIMARSDDDGIFTLALSQNNLPPQAPKRHSLTSNNDSEHMVAMISMKATLQQLEVEEELQIPEHGWITMRVADASLWSTLYAVVNGSVVDFYYDDINLPNKPKKKLSLDISTYIAAIEIEKSTCIKNGFKLLPRPDCNSEVEGCAGPLEFRAESKREKMEWQLCFQEILKNCNDG